MNNDFREYYALFITLVFLLVVIFISLINAPETQKYEHRYGDAYISGFPQLIVEGDLTYCNKIDIDEILCVRPIKNTKKYQLFFVFHEIQDYYSLAEYKKDENGILFQNTIFSLVRYKKDGKIIVEKDAMEVYNWGSGVEKKNLFKIIFEKLKGLWPEHLIF